MIIFRLRCSLNLPELWEPLIISSLILVIVLVISKTTLLHFLGTELLKLLVNELCCTVEVAVATVTKAKDVVLTARKRICCKLFLLKKVEELGGVGGRIAFSCCCT